MSDKKTTHKIGFCRCTYIRTYGNYTYVAVLRTDNNLGVTACRYYRLHNGGSHSYVGILRRIYLCKSQ